MKDRARLGEQEAMRQKQEKKPKQRTERSADRQTNTKETQITTEKYYLNSLNNSINRWQRKEMYLL